MSFDSVVKKKIDVNRLIKVTFVNEVSVKIIMAGYRQCIKQNIDWLITEDLSDLMKLPPEFPKCAAYRRFRVRPELPKETREKMKINAQKVYHMNNEIRTKAESVGISVNESYSLCQDGNIARYYRLRQVVLGPGSAIATFEEFRRRAVGGTPNESYLEQKILSSYEDNWIKDNNWTEDSSSSNV